AGNPGAARTAGTGRAGAGATPAAIALLGLGLLPDLPEVRGLLAHLSRLGGGGLVVVAGDLGRLAGSREGAGARRLGGSLRAGKATEVAEHAAVGERAERCGETGRLRKRGRGQDIDDWRTQLAGHEVLGLGARSRRDRRDLRRRQRDGGVLPVP